MKKNTQKLPALMSLINDRKAWEGAAFKAPKHTAQQIMHIGKIADEYAKANPSDPYAGARKRLYLMRGIDEIKGGGD